MRKGYCVTTQKKGELQNYTTNRGERQTAEESKEDKGPTNKKRISVETKSVPKMDKEI